MRRQRTKRDASDRRFKGAIVQTVRDERTKREAPMRLDKSDMTFWAMAGSEPSSPYFQSKDGGEVELWLERELAKTSENDRLVWFPVVEVAVRDDNHGWSRPRTKDNDITTGFSVDVERYFIALTRDEREWRRLDWEQCDDDSPGCVPPNDRYAQSHNYAKAPKHELFKPGATTYGVRDKPFVLPSMAKLGSGAKSVLPYTPELWAGLLQVVQRIDAERAALDKLTGTKAGLDVLAKVGAGTLPLRIGAGD